MTAKTGSVVPEDCVVVAGQDAIESCHSAVLFSLVRTGTMQIETYAYTFVCTTPVNVKAQLRATVKQIHERQFA